MLIHLFTIVTLAVCVTITIPVEAADEAAQKAQGCASAETTLALRSCESARYVNAEKQLNSAYRQLEKSLDLGRRIKLRVAQRAWLRFREADARFQGDGARGGTLAPLLEVSALADLTEARTAELRKAMQR